QADEVVQVRSTFFLANKYPVESAIPPRINTLPPDLIKSFRFIIFCISLNISYSTISHFLCQRNKNPDQLPVVIERINIILTISSNIRCLTDIRKFYRSGNHGVKRT